MVTYVKISELPPATEATGDSELEVNQSGVTRKITVDQIADVIAEILPPPDMSDYATDEELADAIAAIPDPAWTEITGKPATFPPTVPIAWTDVSGKPASFPPDPEAVDDRVAALLVAGANVTLNYNDAANSLTIASTASGGGAGTVTSTSVVSANGLAGTVATPTTTPAITLSTTVSGMLKGNGTAISAGTAGTDYVIPSGLPTSLPPSGTAGGDLAGTYPNPLIKPSVTNGQVLTTVAGIAAWAAAAGGGASISVGLTPPASPTTGQMWWNTDAAVGGGAMYIYYDSFWVPASPGVGSGAVVQTVSYQTGAVATGTALIPFDDTIPQIGEGTEFMTCAITPRSATSKLIVDVVWYGSIAVAANIVVALFQDATANALAVTSMYQAANTAPVTISFRHVMTSGTTSATTFRVRAGPIVSNTLTINGTGGTRAFGGVAASSIVIQEVL